METTVKDRLCAYLKHKRITKTEFGQTIGVSPAYVTSMRSSIQPGKLQRITEHFPDLNPGWLMTGEGTMLRDGSGADGAQSAPQNGCMVPVIHIDSVGGMASANAEGLDTQYRERQVYFPGAVTGDIAIHQTGDSMSPTIPPGSLILLREILDWREYFGYGNIFVLLLNDWRRVTKQVDRYDPDPVNYVLCVSHNPNVGPEELPKRFIRRVWKVINILSTPGW